MIRKLFIFSLFAAINFNIPIHGMDADHEPRLQLSGSRRKGPSGLLITGYTFLAGGFYLIGTGIYVEQRYSGEADHFQLYEAVRLQESWWIHKRTTGLMIQESVFKKAADAGIKKSILYKKALQYAEEQKDQKIAAVLKKRLIGEGEPAESLSETTIPTPTQTVQNPAQTPPAEPEANDKIKQTGFSTSTLIGSCAVTAVVIGATVHALSQKKHQQASQNWKDAEAGFNIQIADRLHETNRANARAAQLQAQLNSLRRQILISR